MGHVGVPSAVVGNEFVLPRPQLRVALPSMTPEPEVIASSMPLGPALRRDFTPPDNYGHFSLLERFGNLLHRYSLAAFALLFLIVASSGIEVATGYWSAHVAATAQPAAVATSITASAAALNITVPSYQLDAELQTITAQPATLTIGSRTLAISYDTIKSWLQITANSDKTVYYIHVDPAAIINSLTKLASQHVETPVNQVATIAAAGPSGIIIPGTNGTALSDPGSLTQQARQLAKSVLSGGGLHFSTPLKSVPFQAVTPDTFNQLIDVDTTTGQLSAYQNGQLVNTFAVTVGAPTSPTPLGEFQVWQKLPTATMVNYNAKGNRHTSFSVPSVLDFDHSGDAICGSVGTPARDCLGLPTDQAQWLYNWAPLGTTVITHT